jgi:ribonuclease E
LAESLFDEEELGDVDVTSSDVDEVAPTEGESYARGAEKRGRRRRRGRRGRRDREGSAEAGAESGREIRPRPDDEVGPEIGISPERPARIATPFESGEVEFDESDEEAIAEPETRIEQYERDERHGGRRRRRRSRGGRGVEAESRRAPEPSPTRRFEEDEALEDADEVLEPLDDDLESSEGADQELDEEAEDVHVRPVRSSVPSWHDAIGDIIARNMASRHKSGGGGSGYSSGGRRGRGRGGRRSGPRDRN